MQDHSALSRTFFHRTNRLAVELGLDVEDLPVFIGMGRRTLFDCRKSDAAVSGKSWAKLESAEHKAGLKSAEKCEKTQSSANPKGYDVGDPTCVMREDSPIYAARAPQPLTLDERVEKLEKIMAAIAEALKL
jgi:hypothetical protein